MTITRISLAAAKAQLPAFVDSVATKSDRYVIERDGKPVAALIPVSELQRLEQDDVEPTGLELLFGSIPEDAEEEWDAIIGEVCRSRRAGLDEPLPSGEPRGPSHRSAHSPMSR